MGRTVPTCRETMITVKSRGRAREETVGGAAVDRHRALAVGGQKAAIGSGVGAGAGAGSK